MPWMQRIVIILYLLTERARFLWFEVVCEVRKFLAVLRFLRWNYRYMWHLILKIINVTYCWITSSHILSPLGSLTQNLFVTLIENFVALPPTCYTLSDISSLMYYLMHGIWFQKVQRSSGFRQNINEQITSILHTKGYVYIDIKERRDVTLV
jgi:hypothetical protein